MIQRVQEFLSRLASIFRKTELDRDFDAELATHIDLLTEQNQRRGLSPAEARRRAILQMGGMDVTRELHREWRGVPRLEDILHGSIQAWRSWQGAKSVAFLAVAALAVGIGSTTAIYTIVNGVMLKPLPYRDGERFVAMLASDSYQSERFARFVSPEAQIYQERTTSFDGFGWFREAGKNVLFAGEPHHIRGTAVTLSLIPSLGVEPTLGQWFHDSTGAVISTSLWQRLGADPKIIGQPISLDGQIFTITGVMPESFHLPVGGMTSTGLRSDVWIPLNPRERAGEAYTIYARRRPGVALETAYADVKRVAAQIAQEDPQSHEFYAARLFDLRETVVQDIKPTLLLLFAASGLLFLITCATAAGLMLARSVSRARETAMRIALGASRLQLAVHYLSEGLFISLAGAAGGILLALGLTHAIVSMAANYLPRADEIEVDRTVLLFALSAAFLANLLSSLAPLRQAARTAPADALGEGMRVSAGVRSRLTSQSLVVGEIALAFTLLVGSVVLITHLQNLSRTAVGFDPDQVLSFVLSLPGFIADDEKVSNPLKQRIVSALRTIPGVEDVAYATHLPFKNCCTDTWIFPDGRPVDPNASPRANGVAVSSEYFRAMRIPLRSGRFIAESDVVLKPKSIAVVINQAAASRYWGEANPVGTSGRLGDPSGMPFHVIGVSGDVKNRGLGSPADPEIYMAAAYVRIEGMNVVVRSTRPLTALLPEIRRAIREVHSEIPIYDVITMRDVIRQTMTLERAASFLTVFFAAAALLMATLGVYGVVSYSVRQRTVEIGVRMALGATWHEVLSLILRSGLKIAAYGVFLGAIASAIAALYLARTLPVGEIGPAPLLFSTLIVAAVALAASFIPAWRAALVSPIVAIRNER